MKSLAALYPSQYRKYVYGLHGAEVLKQALYKCAELRMKKQPACLSDVLQTYFRAGKPTPLVVGLKS